METKDYVNKLIETINKFLSDYDGKIYIRYGCCHKFPNHLKIDDNQKYCRIAIVYKNDDYNEVQRYVCKLTSGLIPLYTANKEKIAGISDATDLKELKEPINAVFLEAHNEDDSTIEDFIYQIKETISEANN